MGSSPTEKEQKFVRLSLFHNPPFIYLIESVNSSRSYSSLLDWRLVFRRCVQRNSRFFGSTQMISVVVSVACLNMIYSCPLEHALVKTLSIEFFGKILCNKSDWSEKSYASLRGG